MPTETEKEQKQKELAKELLKEMSGTGMTPKMAKSILDSWSNQVGHEVTPEDLRKILVGQSTKAFFAVAISTLFDAGSAYTAFIAGGYLGLASIEWGTPALVGQAVAYLLAGYYATGVVLDFFKLGAVAVAAANYNLNSSAFLEAIEGIAGAGSGLVVADKAREAVNSVKVLNALSKLSDELRAQTRAPSTSNSEMLADLGAYLTLDRAQRHYGFDASKFGLSGAEAADIATCFGKYDTNDDGVLGEDEFRKLCANLSPELSDDEVKAAIAVIDVNQDGSIQFDEFVRFWQKQGLKPEA